MSPLAGNASAAAKGEAEDEEGDGDRDHDRDDDQVLEENHQAGAREGGRQHHLEESRHDEEAHRDGDDGRHEGGLERVSGPSPPTGSRPKAMADGNARE